MFSPQFKEVTDIMGRQGRKDSPVIVENTIEDDE